MVTEQQVTAQQSGVVPYQAGTLPASVLSIVSILPMMFFMFFFMMLMALMRDVASEPGAAKALVIKGIETGKGIVGR